MAQKLLDLQDDTNTLRATHQQLAAVCENVVFVAAGLPIAMKGVLPLLDP